MKEKILTDIQILGEHYREEWKKRHGRGQFYPTVNWGMAGKRFKPMLKEYGMDTCKRLVEIYLRNFQNDRIVESSGWALNIFFAKVNACLTMLASEPKARPALRVVRDGEGESVSEERKEELKKILSSAGSITKGL